MRGNSLVRSVILCAALFLAPPAHAAPKVQKVTTPSGIKALLVESHDLPVIAAVVTFKDAGSASDAPGKFGRAYMSSRMVTQGAGEYDAEAFSRRLQEKAILLTSSVDADFFNLNLKTLSENADEAFRLLGLSLTRPRFDEEAVARIRADALADLGRLEADAGYLSARGLDRLAYPAHPYGQPRQGERDTVAALSVEDYRFFAEHYFARDTMLLGVVGDITPARLSELLEANLAHLPAAAKPERAVSEVAIAQPGAIRVRTHPSPQAVVSFALPGLKRDDPKFYTAYLLNHLLGGGTLTSRLSEELREKRGLVYYASSFSAITLHGKALYGSFATRNPQAKEAIAAFKDVLARIGKDGVSEAELRQAKDYLIGSFALQLDTNTALANMLIAIQAYHLGNDYMEKRNGYMEAVTRAQVNALAKELLSPEKAIISVAGQPEGMEPTP